ncbi:MAG: hypothetical protein QGH39_08070 [Candidatus Thermoplasmatota archaeon]|jgi:hypothetical protein|nr:hypothetical protein [Candidatus Thermoplasmatota archaeon]MDP7265502.1 hypothetical protein [Candidatus Thermoplasmatota archaeon]
MSQMIDKKLLLGNKAYPLKTHSSNDDIIVFAKGLKIKSIKIPIKDDEKRFDTAALQGQIPSMLMGGKWHIILFDEIVSVKQFEGDKPNFSFIGGMKNQKYQYLEFLIRTIDPDEKFMVTYDDPDPERFKEVRDTLKEGMGRNTWENKLETALTTYPENTKDWQEYFSLIREFYDTD